MCCQTWTDTVTPVASLAVKAPLIRSMSMQQRHGSRLDRREMLERSYRALIVTAATSATGGIEPRWCLAQSENDSTPKNDSAQETDAQEATTVPSTTVSIVRFRDRDGSQTSVEGRVLIRATNGGLLVEDSASRLWTIPAEQLDQEMPTDRIFQLLDGKALGQSIQTQAEAAGVEADFHMETTESHVIVATTTEACSTWTRQLLERIQIAFQSYWKNRGFELSPLRGPMAVLILSDRTQFAKMAAYDRTPASAQGEGYYLVTANRIVLFDLTSRDGAPSAATVAEVQRRAQTIPASVATVVHEATHQIAFNRGMHRRYADNPVWLTEGMAMYFEAPDLRSRRGWSTIGKVNEVRLHRFRQFIRSGRGVDSIESLVRDNSRFSDPELAPDAYAEAWALTYFLIRTRIRDYSQYIQQISQKIPLQWDTPDERLSEFQSAFGSDLIKLNQDLQRFTSRLR